MQNEFLKEVAHDSAVMGIHRMEVKLDGGSDRQLIHTPYQRTTAQHQYRRNIYSLMRLDFDKICGNIEGNLWDEGRPILIHGRPAKLAELADRFLQKDKNQDLLPIIMSGSQRAALVTATQGMLALHFLRAADMPYEKAAANMLVKHVLTEIGDHQLQDLLSIPKLAEQVENAELPLPIPPPFFSEAPQTSATIPATMPAKTQALSGGLLVAFGLGLSLGAAALVIKTMKSNGGPSLG